jgi:hypothetical protein
LETSSVFACTKVSSNDGIRDARVVVEPKDSTSLRALKSEICRIGRHVIALESLEDWEFDGAIERGAINVFGPGESRDPVCHDQ